MNLFSRLQREAPEILPVGLTVVRTECCGLVVMKNGQGAPLYYLATDEELLDTPTEINVHTLPEEP